MSTPQIDEASYNSPPDGTYITRNLAASAVKPDGEGGTASEADRRRTTANLGGFAMKGKITTCCPQAAMLSRIIMENRQQFPHRVSVSLILYRPNGLHLNVASLTNPKPYLLGGT